jgi:hypothetical protein
MIFREGEIDMGGLELAVIAGLIIIIAAAQAKMLPSDKDADAALKKLALTPDDVDANTVVGRYLAFVKEDWDKAVPYIVKGKDKPLIAMIDEEKKDDANKFTATEIGDKWLKAGDSAGTMKPYYRDRAIDWYGKGWERGTKDDPVWGDALRKRLETLQSTVGGKGSRAGKVPGWNLTVSEIGLKYVRRGSQSIKLVPNSFTISDLYPAKPGKDFVLTGWALTDGNNAVDAMSVKAFDAAGSTVLEQFMNIPPDQPYWKKIVMNSTFPANAAKFQVGLHTRSNKGATWIDTASLTVDGVEQLKNPSFEP